MKIYFICSSATWEKWASKLGSTHGVKLPGGDIVFHGYSEDIHPDFLTYFSGLQDVITFPSLFSNAEIGEATVKRLPANIGAIPTDMPYQAARKLMQLSPVFDPDCR